MPTKPDKETDNEPDSETVRTLRTVAHMTGSFMAANIAAYYSATAHLQGHETQSFLFGLVGLVPVGYGLWYAIENQTQEFTFFEAEHFLDPDIDTGTNPTGSNHAGPSANTTGRGPRSVIEDAVADVLRNETTQPTADVAVTTDPHPGISDIPLAASFEPSPTPRPAIGTHLAKAVALVGQLASITLTNLSTAAGTLVIIALVTLGLFA